MCVVYFNFFFFLTGNLALCGAFSNLRADKWRTQVKSKICYRISIHYWSHVPPVGNTDKSLLVFYTRIPSSSDESGNIVLFFLLCK
jgi:hypothetical protein